MAAVQSWRRAGGQHTAPPTLHQHMQPGGVKVSHLEGEHSAVVAEVVGLVAWGLHHEAGARAKGHVGAGVGILIACASQQAGQARECH